LSIGRGVARGEIGDLVAYHCVDETA